MRLPLLNADEWYVWLQLTVWLQLSSAESSFASSADSSTVSCSGIGVRTASVGSSSEAELETVKAELQGIAAVLRHHVAGCARVLTIPKARRPIIRFYHNDLKCSCDLTVDNQCVFLIARGPINYRLKIKRIILTGRVVKCCYII